MVQRCPGLADLREIAAGHHERLDGSGYHRGVGGHDQSKSARILAAADVFAALTEPRPHRPAFSADDAAQLSYSSPKRQRAGWTYPPAPRWWRRRVYASRAPNSPAASPNGR
ncbi:HD-GYP domain-containing protein [Nocardia xishanensis]